MAIPPATGLAALKPTFEKSLDAIKWVIGLPVAILYGTTQFVEKIDFAKHPYAGSLFWWIIVVNATGVVIAIWYYFRAINRADLKLLGSDYSWKFSDSLSFYGGIALVFVGFLLTVVGLINYPAVQFEKKFPSVTPASHYVISTSGPVHDRMGTHFHTFLVNETTGEVWRMECKEPSGVQFLHVPVQDSPSAQPIKIR
jgi:hypothetical protein